MESPIPDSNVGLTPTVVDPPLFHVLPFHNPSLLSVICDSNPYLRSFSSGATCFWVSFPPRTVEV